MSSVVAALGSLDSTQADLIRRFAPLTARSPLRKISTGARAADAIRAASAVREVVREAEELWGEWMAAGVAGDAAAYRRLLDALTPRLRAFVVRHLVVDYAADVEDIVQEILIAVHTQRTRYNVKKPIAPWLFAIARYKLIDHCRRAKRRGVSIPVDAIEDLFAAPEQEEAIDTSEIGPLLEQLPDKQRTAIDLVKVQAMSVREAAKTSGMSEAAIRVNVHRGIKALAGIVAKSARS